MKKYIMSVGLNDKDTKVQKIDIIEAYKIVQNTLLANNLECTIYNAQGIYKHENGEIVVENTLRVELYEFSDSIRNQILKSIETLKVVLNQESIALETIKTNSELI